MNSRGGNIRAARQLTFAYIYARAYPHWSGVKEGIKLGLAAAVMVSLSSQMVQWTLYPIGASVPAVVMPFEFAMWALSGVVVAVLYRPKLVGRHEVGMDRA